MAILVLPRGEIRIRAFGLDVDGVLRDTGIHIYEATCKAIKELGGNIRPNFQDFLAAQGSKGENGLFAKCGVFATDAEIHTAYYKHVPDHDVEQPFEDVESFLHTLVQKDLKIFVVSRHPTERLMSWFKRNNLHPHVERLQGDSASKALHIREICKDLGVDTTESCYAGDWGNDMKQALLADVLPIGVTRTHETRDHLIAAGAEYVVDHLSELIPMIR